MAATNIDRTEPPFHALPVKNCLGRLPRYRASDLRPGNLLPTAGAIITGAMNGWKTDDWSLPAFARRFGSRKVTVTKMTKGIAKFKGFDSITFSDFIETMANPDADHRYYLSLSPIWNARPGALTTGEVTLGELGDDIVKPTFIDDRLLQSAHLWIAYDESNSNMHFDGRDNLMSMITGRKRFIILSDEQTPNLYPNSARESNYGQSRVTFSNIDFAKYPRLLEAKYYEDSIGPGETLYLPYMWWHYFTSEPGSIAVNYWAYPASSVVRGWIDQPRTHLQLLLGLVAHKLRLGVTGSANT